VNPRLSEFGKNRWRDEDLAKEPRQNINGFDEDEAAYRRPSETTITVQPTP